MINRYAWLVYAGVYIIVDTAPNEFETARAKLHKNELQIMGHARNTQEAERLVNALNRDNEPEVRDAGT